MSYDLYLHLQPATHRARVLDHFAARRHYKITGDKIVYAHPDTGVYFFLTLRCGRDLLLRRTVRTIEFELNYNRPGFFSTEAEKEVSDLISVFHPRIEDPQIDGMGDGFYSSAKFFSGWNFGNRFAVHQILASNPDTALASLPEAELSAAWRWNYDRAECQRRKSRWFIPAVQFGRIEGRVCRVAVWPEDRPVVLPLVDYVLLGRIVAGQKRYGIAPWSEVLDVANKAGFDTAKVPLELGFLGTPPEIARWSASIPPMDLGTIEPIEPYAILDEEMVARARESVARDAGGPTRPPGSARDRESNRDEAVPSFDQTPDEPRSFGYKVSWFALRTSDPASVVDALEFGEATPANWASGLAAAYSDRDPQTGDAWIFVSPPIHGWVLAVSAWWPYPVALDSQAEGQHEIGRKFDLLFSRLMKRFDDVQFFGSYRVVGFVTWARAVNGKPIRIFGFGDEVLANMGEQTPEEAQLKFADLSGLSPADAHDRIYEIAEEQDAELHRLTKSGLSHREARAKVRESGRDAIPDETDVTDLAALWSIDPADLSDQDDPLGAGVAARLPKQLVQ